MYDPLIALFVASIAMILPFLVAFIVFASLVYCGSSFYRKKKAKA